ncbi:hypothetical protein [Actinoplanes solisilvae]|uniref:hypothetical protein n=1 Tax=Actinoplanes solisilvae TaxID=2486853 RepID=UPI000FDB7775|nr:hypothetical protein [Actinoplanes solisilvae]
MLCERCGSHLERPGQGHTCRPYAAPEGLPLGWQVTTWVVVGLAVLLMACTVVSALVRLRVGGNTQPLNWFAADLLLGAAWLVLAAGLLAALLVWSRSTRRLAGRFSDTSGWYVSVSSVLRVYALLLLLGVGITCLGTGGAGTIVVVSGVVQLLAIAFLAVAVVAGWARIRRLETDSYTQTYYGTSMLGGLTPPASTPAATPLTGHATDADWNPHEWDPEVRDEIERRRKDS